MRSRGGGIQPGFNHHELDEKMFMETCVTFPQLDEKKDVPCNLYNKEHIDYLYTLLHDKASKMKTEGKSCMMLKAGVHEIAIPAKAKTGFGRLVNKVTEAKIPLEIKLHTDILMTHSLGNSASRQLPKQAQFQKKHPVKTRQQALTILNVDSQQNPPGEFQIQVMGKGIREGNTHQVYKVEMVIVPHPDSKSLAVHKSGAIVKKRHKRKKCPPIDFTRTMLNGYRQKRVHDELKPLQEASFYQEGDDFYVIQEGYPGVSLDQFDFRINLYFNERVALINEICRQVMGLSALEKEARKVFVRIPLNLHKIIWDVHHDEKSSRHRIHLLSHTWRTEEVKEASMSPISPVDDVAALASVFEKILNDGKNIPAPYWAEDTKTDEIRREITCFLQRMKSEVPEERPTLEAVNDFFSRYTDPRFIQANQLVYQAKKTEVCSLIEDLKQLWDHESYHEVKSLYGRLKARKEGQNLVKDLYNAIRSANDAEAKQARINAKPPTLHEIENVMEMCSRRKAQCQRLFDSMVTLQRIKSNQRHAIIDFLTEVAEHQHTLKEMEDFLNAQRKKIFEERVLFPLQSLLKVMSTVSTDIGKPLREICLERKSDEVSIVSINQAAQALWKEEKADKSISTKKNEQQSKRLQETLNPLSLKLKDFPLEYTEEHLDKVNVEIVRLRKQYDQFNEAVSVFFQALAGSKFIGSNSDGIRRMQKVGRGDEDSFDKLLSVLAEAKSRESGCRNALRRLSFFGKGRHAQVDALYQKMNVELRVAAFYPDQVKMIPQITAAVRQITQFIEDKEFLHRNSPSKRS